MKITENDGPDVGEVISRFEREKAAIIANAEMLAIEAVCLLELASKLRSKLRKHGHIKASKFPAADWGVKLAIYRDPSKRAADECEGSEGELEELLRTAETKLKVGVHTTDEWPEVFDSGKDDKSERTDRIDSTE